MALPPDVHAVRSGGRIYYYFQKGRGRTKELRGPRIALGSDATDPRFWEKLKELSQTQQEEPERGSVDAMIAEFKASPEWQAYSENTANGYSFYLAKLSTAWGKLPASGVTPKAVLALRDALSTSPGSANHLLSVGKRLWRFGVPREYAPTNPFREVEKFGTQDNGHWPWPKWALDFVFERAWPDLVRFVRLAVATGQRESDLVRIGPSAIDGRGLWIRPQKTRRHRKAIWVPLSETDYALISQWQHHGLVFERAGRWQHRICCEPGEAFILSPAGNPYSTDGLQSRWNRWLRTADGMRLVKDWTQWQRSILERDGEEIDEDEDIKPTLHGLRATAVVARRMAGFAHQQISNDIGMSISMVIRYSRFMDQKQAAEGNILLLDWAKKRADQ